ncbi:MAG: DeoR/GlpR family DNA-binding transcription regulator [Thermanaeromonas sp.]|uniref:DeoR/GlpR family DNA-binding transcription regulator n=1 Tax=Thermanaeromonas sp. TaxID=2003697 RepID=UPI00243D4054|nr:DeoR/GlpR family DNA-binding transcription regulator [Thermanaeromonas sp.]MCG0277972.1 DeoR/GlpR family DNA-binding transcription regulator [Thermanaeromonas sp.]
MLTLERRQKILQWVLREGRAEVGELASAFGVSTMTIRRDLKALEDEGLLTRSRGGALPKNGLIGEIPYRSKATSHLELKKGIAKVAADLVENNDTVILDAGSTTLEVARCLKRSKENLTIVTNDLNIAMELADVPGFKVLTTGGEVQPGVYCLLGEEALSFLRSITVNIAFLGAGAVDLTGLYTPTLDKVYLKRAMIGSAGKVVLVADHTKFGRKAFAKVCELKAMDFIITDNGLAPQVVAEIERLGVNLILAEPEKR